MRQFVIETYQGNYWMPVVIWANVENFRAALLRLERHCKLNNIDQATHRIKILRTQDEIIDANQRIEADKKKNHG